MAIAFPFHLPLVSGVGTVGFKQYDADGTALSSGSRVTAGITEIPSGSGQYWTYDEAPFDGVRTVIADDAAGNFTRPISVVQVSKESLEDDGFAVGFSLPLVSGVGTVGFRQYDVNGNVLAGGARTTSPVVELIANSGVYWTNQPDPDPKAWFILADDAAGNYSNIIKVVQPTVFKGPSTLGGPEDFFIDDSFGAAYYVIYRDAAFDTWCPAEEEFVPFTTHTTSFAIPMTQNGSTGAWSVPIPGGSGHRTWSIYEQPVADVDPDTSTDVKAAEGYGFFDGASMELGVAVDAIGMTLLRGNNISAVDGSGVTGQNTLKAVLLDPQQRVYNTSTQTINTSINSIPWNLALIDLTEKSGESGDGTAIYEAAMPVVPLGPYTLLIQVGTSQAAQRLLAEQFFWDGQTVVPLDGILLDAYSFLRKTSPIGGGNTAKKLTISAHNGGPVPQATVRVTTDAAGQNVVSGDLITDDLGQVTFMLNVGSYYAWAFRANTNMVNPKSFSVP